MEKKCSVHIAKFKLDFKEFKAVWLVGYGYYFLDVKGCS